MISYLEHAYTETLFAAYLNSNLCKLHYFTLDHSKFTLCNDIPIYPIYNLGKPTSVFLFANPN